MSLAHTQLPFAEQINYFRKKLDLPTESYADIYGAEHDHAFVVAGANRLDMVADFRRAVDKAIADGTTLEEFRRNFDNIVAKYGWQYNGGRDWRSKLIYDTNLHASYQAGRYEQQMEMRHLRPYWEYRHRDGQKHPRPEHEAWNGLVLHCDDPWWQTHYPINAYGCKCTVFAHSKRSLERRGLKVGEAPAIEWQQQLIGKNSSNPRLVDVPKGIDPGFDRIPGQNAGRDGLQRLFDKASAVPPKLATRAMQQVLDDPRTRQMLNRQVAEMVDNIFAGAHTKGRQLSIGTIPTPIIDALAQEGIALQTSVITLRDHDIWHVQRTVKVRPLPQSYWRNIADYIANPQAAFLDDSETPPTLIYLCAIPGTDAKIVLKLNYNDIKTIRAGGGRERHVGNIIRSGNEILTPDQLQALGIGNNKLIYGHI